MTCIVGVTHKGDVYLGGDRAATDGGLNRVLIKDPKIFLKGNIGFGICGLPKVIDALQHAIELPEDTTGGSGKAWLVGHAIPAIREGLKKLECTEADQGGTQYFPGAMLIGYRGHLYQLESNFQLVEAAHGFDATGSGGEAALGSLRSTKKMGNPQKRLLEALEVSAEHNAGVAPPFDIICVKRR